MKTNFYFPKALLSITTLFILAISFISCNKSDDVGNIKVDAAITIVDGAPSSTTQTVYLDNSISVTPSGIAYPQSSGYNEITSGNHTITVKDAVTGAVNSTATLNAGSANYYTAFYADDKSILVVQDNRTAPLTQTQSRVRIVNLSSALPGLDFSPKGGTKFVGGLAYKTASPYFDYESGTTFSLYTAGSNTVLLDVPVTFVAGHLYTIFITGSTLATVQYQMITQD